MNDRHCYHAAGGIPHMTLPPLPLPLLQLPPLSTQTWAATCLAAVGPLSSNHHWIVRASKLSELWASYWGPCIYRVQNKQQKGRVGIVLSSLLLIQPRMQLHKRKNLGHIFRILQIYIYDITNGQIVAEPSKMHYLKYSYRL